MKVSVYIKMDFKGNPRGKGKAAALIEFVNKEGVRHIRKQIVSMDHETKNCLALAICINALRTLVKPCEAVIFIENQYIRNACVMGWVERWKQDDWKRATGKQPANVEEWKQLYMLIQIHKVKIEKYVSNYENELVEMVKGTEER